MRFTIAKKIVIATASIVLLGVVIASYSVIGSLDGAKMSKDMAEAFLPANVDVKKVSTEVLLSRIYTILYLSDGLSDSKNSALNHMKELRSGFELMKELTNSPDHTDKFPTTVKLLPNMEKDIAKFIESSKVSMEASVDSNDAGKLLSAQLLALKQGLYDFSQTVLKALKTEMRGSNNAYKEALVEMFAISNSISVNIGDVYGLLAVAIQKNSAESFPQIRKLMSEIDKELATLGELVTVEANKKMARSHREDLKKVSALIDSTETIFINYSKSAKDRMDSVNSLEKAVDSISTLIQNRLIDSSNDSVKMQISSLKISIILLIALILAGFITIFILNRSVTNPISEFVKLVGDLTSGDGDLTKRIKAVNNDELADLATNFNKFIENVQQIIIEVKSSADEVASGNNQLAATMEELSQTFDSQTRQVSDMVMSMDNISSISRTAVDDLNGSLNILTKTTDLTKNGAKQLSGIKSSIININSQTESLSITIGKLTESSTQIGAILSVINDIADQTNLLALNAAIEAARAGDAGRGFAVVADEVRKLAERTQKATSEIELIITSLQKESETASTEMMNASQTVVQGVKDIEITSNNFIEVVTGVEGINSNVQGVSSSVGEQYQSVQSVVDNTQVFASGLEESNAAVSEVSSTVSHLQERAEKLKALVGKFKV